MKKFYIDERDTIIPANQAEQVEKERQKKEAKLEKERKAKERQDAEDLLFLMEAKFGSDMSIPMCKSLDEAFSENMRSFDSVAQRVNTFLKQHNASSPRKGLPPDQEELLTKLRTNVTIREPYNDLILLKKQLQETQQQQEIEIVKIGTRNLMKGGESNGCFGGWWR